MRKIRGLGLLFACFFATSALRAQDTTAEWHKLVDSATAYIKKSQNPDGSWGGARFKNGVTGIVITGLVKSGGAKVSDEATIKGLKYIESLVNTKEGHIAGPGSNVQLSNYITCVNVMALQAANQNDKYKAVVGDAVKFLKQLQFDEASDKKKSDGEYGGIGYDGKSRPDLSNTQFFLDALHDAGVPKDDPSLQKAMIFVSRCQNLKSEYNDRPWAGKINDGSFIYGVPGNDPKKDNLKDPMAGYASMTYAGIKSMVYCGVSKDDLRYKKALEWISMNYSVDVHPGMPKETPLRGLYYYYHTMAKTLAVMEIDTITDAKGIKHDWRKELIEAFAKRQKPDGSWTNESDRFMEGDPALVTGYVLNALSYCKPKTK
ncbi:terpene cyclase/mutase family protein [Telmatocola sphagniphila]|uniref:Terpene cyclase/mutase family protein n=1 Tax=Telmatocola sphagniphila TaxID=1123043 RepID=A0A8E6BC85_9BACT|nr:prenyltransferase/squalene oxidase repeat-containing protein [Telmatocola sphagniphila]QVL34503.1 terpene cyclase/mutase family protein [Telmatocola sphagniphila]